MRSRLDRSPIATWWWTLDRWLLAAICTLMVLGLLFALAGSPAVAERLKLPLFYFVNRQLLFLIPTFMIMIAVSFFSQRWVRRSSMIIYICAFALIVIALYFGIEVKGARRWIFGIQPSEFIKPVFVVLVAWAFSQSAMRKDVPGNWLAFLMLPLTIIPLMLQPDYGQTMLICLVWAALFFVAGLHLFWIGGIGIIGAAGVLMAYKFVPHVRGRIVHFFERGSSGSMSDTFQVDAALESFMSGGWFGKGPGEGSVKLHLPDSHTDFIFAVTGEEFGIVVCLALVGIFMFILMRGLILALRHPDPFSSFASAGLLMLFGIQGAINMAVNLHLMPAKGMTLPFISYGGSSLIAMGLGMGFVLALLRKRPTAHMEYYS